MRYHKHCIHCDKIIGKDSNNTIRDEFGDIGLEFDADFDDMEKFCETCLECPECGSKRELSVIVSLDNWQEPTGEIKEELVKKVYCAACNSVWNSGAAFAEALKDWLDNPIPKAICLVCGGDVHYYPFEFYRVAFGGTGPKVCRNCTVCPACGFDDPEHLKPLGSGVICTVCEESWETAKEYEAAILVRVQSLLQDQENDEDDRFW